MNVVYAQKGMLQRLKAEGRNTPADAVLTVDISRLDALTNAELLQPVSSPVLNRNIPSQYRHPQGFWYGLTTRARIIYAHKDRVEARRGRVLRGPCETPHEGAGLHPVRQARLYGLPDRLDHRSQGREGGRGVAQGRQGEPRPQAAGATTGRRSRPSRRACATCPSATPTTWAKWHTNDKNPVQKEWAASVRIVFPNQAGRGTHVNISGAAVTEHAKNKANAVRLLEFLSENFAQKMYAERNFEYPVKAGVELHPMVAGWGKFQAPMP